MLNQKHLNRLSLRYLIWLLFQRRLSGSDRDAHVSIIELLPLDSVPVLRHEETKRTHGEAEAIRLLFK
jgi:hypothetical protein